MTFNFSLLIDDIIEESVLRDTFKISEINPNNFSIFLYNVESVKDIKNLIEKHAKSYKMAIIDTYEAIHGNSMVTLFSLKINDIGL